MNVFIDREQDYVQIEMFPETPKQFRDMMTEVLPGVLESLYNKSLDYGDNANVLGIKGQFADIWRKIGKLKRALWDDIPLRYEQPDEICSDLIGHVLLTMNMLRKENKA